jgi:hypothetical protein
MYSLKVLKFSSFYCHSAVWNFKIHVQNFLKISIYIFDAFRIYNYIEISVKLLRLIRKDDFIVNLYMIIVY